MRIKTILATTLLTLMFWGCTHDRTNYARILEGTWINTAVDHKPILTDATYVCQFRPDKVEVYAFGAQLDINNKSWVENDSYTYSVKGKTITIEGTDVLGKFYHMEVDIISMTQDSFSTSVKAFIVNGVDRPDPKIYSYKRITSDDRNQLLGIWYGRCITPESRDNKYHYWEYFADGRFNYYYQDGAGNWVKKKDNEGFYFVYGNFLATNYTNDWISRGSGKEFECWNFFISGTQMIWTGLRDNNKTITYQMEKVAHAPEILPIVNNPENSVMYSK